MNDFILQIIHRFLLGYILHTGTHWIKLFLLTKPTYFFCMAIYDFTCLMFPKANCHRAAPQIGISLPNTYRSQIGRDRVGRFRNKVVTGDDDCTVLQYSRSFTSYSWTWRALKWWMLLNCTLAVLIVPSSVSDAQIFCRWDMLTLLLQMYSVSARC